MTSSRVSRWRQRVTFGRGSDVQEATTSLVRGVPYGVQILHGVPTFNALQRICAKYLAEHQFSINRDARPTCACRLQLATYGEWLEHVTELQASHIAMTIQEARNTTEDLAEDMELRSRDR